MGVKSHTFSEIHVASRTATANRVEINTSKGIRLKNGATCWEDIKIPLYTARFLGLGKDPSFAQVVGGVRAFVFANAASEEVHFAFEMPHAWKRGTDVYFHVHNMTVSTAVGTILWDFEYIFADRPGRFLSTPVRVTVGTRAASALAYRHLRTSDASLVLVKNAKDISGILIGRLCRRGDIDDYGGDIAGIVADVHYEVDGFGSEVEHSKLE